MKKNHIWIVGLDERGTPDYTDFDFRQDVCLVLGSEGSGLHDLVKRTCDHLLRIPMAGSVSSLNVSVAGAVVMYEAMRQRRAQPPAPNPPRRSLNLQSPAKASAPRFTDLEHCPRRAVISTEAQRSGETPVACRVAFARCPCFSVCHSR